MTAAGFEAVRGERPPRATGLGNAHYVDPRLFEAEKHALLFSAWMGIGFAKDVPEPGDARQITFLGVPLLLLRDREGTVRVFQNTCRHRGMILVSEPTTIRGAIRCPYHSWCYGLDGALRAAPHVGGVGQNRHDDIDPGDLGLFEFRTHVWKDVVFVNIDGTARPFAEAHADLLARWQEFEQPLHHGGTASSFTLVVESNWKLAVENYCESYHLPWVHPGLNSYSRLEDHYNVVSEDRFSGQGTKVYAQIEAADGATFPDFAGLGGKWDEGAEYLAIYPNVLVGVQRDHVHAIVLEPESCGRTVEHIELYYAAPADETPELEALRSENARLWKTVFAEDVAVVEGMQKGRHGPLFDGGRFSPVMDEATRAFHDWVAARMHGDGCS